MAVLLANNASSRLAASLSATATSLSVTAGEGAKFPAVTSGNWFPVTLIKDTGVLEILRCTARSGDVLTVVRAQEGTQAQAFSAGDRVELRLTAAVIADINQTFSTFQTQVNNTINNLGLTGSISAFARSSAPTGWLKCNGAAVSRTTYAALFAAIGTTFGAGDGSTTFNLPDLRGEFVRGWDDGRGVDSGRGFGTYQADMFLSHHHTATASTDTHSHNFSANTSVAGAHSHTYKQGAGTSATTGGNQTDATDRNRAYPTATTDSAGAHYHTLGGTTTSDSHTHTITINGNGGNETRPRNRAMLYCIKF